MKLEKRVGDTSTYSEFINGKTRRATTRNGAAGAEKIFSIMRGTNCVETSFPTRDTVIKPYR